MEKGLVRHSGVSYGKFAIAVKNDLKWETVGRADSLPDCCTRVEFSVSEKKLVNEVADYAFGLLCQNPDRLILVTDPRHAVLDTIASTCEKLITAGRTKQILPF